MNTSAVPVDNGVVSQDSAIAPPSYDANSLDEVVDALFDKLKSSGQSTLDFASFFREATTFFRGDSSSGVGVRNIDHYIVSFQQMKETEAKGNGTFTLTQKEPFQILFLS